jgi:MFS family permease
MRGSIERMALERSKPTPAIRRLAASRFISLAGTQAAYIALLALVYDRSHGSGSWLAASLVAALAARVAVSPWAGSLGDRFDRRRVMIASDIAAAACFLAIAQTGSLIALVALSAAASIAEAPFSPASSALLAMVVSDDRRGWANGAVSASSSAGMLIGAAFGGLLVSTLGAAFAFEANAASFLLSAALVYSVKGRFVVDRQDGDEHHGVLAGVRFVASQRVLRTATMSVGLVVLGLGMVNVAELPLFLAIGAGKTGYGIGIAAWSAGAIITGRLAVHVVGWKAERLGLIIGCLAVAVVIGLSGSVGVFAVIAPLFVLGGVANGLVNIALVLSVQRWAPAAVQSRVMAACEAAINAAIGLSLAVGGLLLGPLGPRGVFVLAGTMGALATAAALRLPGDSSPIAPLPESVTPANNTHEPPSRLTPLPPGVWAEPASRLP